ncbi:MAG: DUF1622 domain-containing protein [Oscillatoriales cyanobacterium RM1_1_9]|nr:DUF1622 domain-containing protein [Oscillatoriales cyanobacterium SM2_3_0]NJO47115.1 DUF1622 domain-containing protein [Oscillatoriales cyanobacterium RM2_1_1]NJO72282.1 DUF1622 domain-containing protein [Oscillatoriales cyanobacterium RM1_1_9]
MEWLEFLEDGLADLVQVGQFFLEAISVYCVLVGVIKTLQLALQSRRRKYDEISFTQIRLQLGLWLALALEFQLGADILTTTVAPTTEDLVRLGIIAIIRTLLNYFLNKELEQEYKFKEQTAKAQALKVQKFED